MIPSQDPRLYYDAADGARLPAAGLQHHLQQHPLSPAPSHYASSPAAPAHHIPQRPSASSSALDSPRRFDHAGTPDRPESEASSEVNSPAQNESPSVHDAAAAAAEAKKSRACEACRGLKVRCDQDPNDPSKPCRRCAKARRRCIITAPSRKRQKKSDGKVAELERKIEALTALTANLPHAQESLALLAGASADRDALPQPSQSGSYDLSERFRTDKRDVSGNDSVDSSVDEPSPGAGRKRRHSTEFQPGVPEVDHARAPPPPSSLPAKTLLTDIDIDSQIDWIIDRKAASRIFDQFCKANLRHLPIIFFKPGTPAEEVRANTPVLFLAILVGGSIGHVSIEATKQLNQALLQVFASRIMLNGNKSLELIQSLTLTAQWYITPDKFEQMNFYQLGHIGATMAMEMGLGRRQKRNPHAHPRKMAGNSRLKPIGAMPLPDSLEVRRTWLSCFYQTVNTSFSLRRPALLRWNKYTDECIETLRNSPLETRESDTLLIRYLELQRIMERANDEFHMNDPLADVDISKGSVQDTLACLEGDLVYWKDKVSEEYLKQNPALRFYMHIVNIFMHEVAIHINHNIDDFRAPLTQESLKAGLGQSKIFSPMHANALKQIRSSTHGAFETLLALPPEEIKSLPIIYFVRVAYVTVVLIKLHFAILAPNSEIGKVIKPNTLKVEHYLKHLVTFFYQASEQNSLPTMGKFFIVLARLYSWFEKNKGNAKNLPAQDSRFNPYESINAARATNTDRDENIRMLPPLDSLSLRSNRAVPSPPQHSPQGKQDFNDPSRPPSSSHNMHAAPHAPPPPARYADGSRSTPLEPVNELGAEQGAGNNGSNWQQRYASQPGGPTYQSPQQWGDPFANGSQYQYPQYPGNNVMWHDPHQLPPIPSQQQNPIFYAASPAPLDPQMTPWYGDQGELQAASYEFSSDINTMTDPAGFLDALSAAQFHLGGDIDMSNLTMGQEPVPGLGFIPNGPGTDSVASGSRSNSVYNDEGFPGPGPPQDHVMMGMGMGFNPGVGPPPHHGHGWGGR